MTWADLEESEMYIVEYLYRYESVTGVENYETTYAMAIMREGSIILTDLKAASNNTDLGFGVELQLNDQIDQENFILQDIIKRLGNATEMLKEINPELFL